MIVQVGPLKLGELWASANLHSFRIKQDYRSRFDAERVVGIAVGPLHRVFDEVATSTIGTHKLAPSNHRTPCLESPADLFTGTKGCGRTGLQVPAACRKSIHLDPTWIVVIRGSMNTLYEDVPFGKDHPEVISWVELVGRRLRPQASLRSDTQQVLVRSTCNTVEDLTAAFDLNSNPDILFLGNVVTK